MLLAACSQSQPSTEARETQPAPVEEPRLAYGIAMVERVFVRTAPVTGAPAIGTLRHGTVFDVVEERGDWLRARDAGWLIASEARTNVDNPPAPAFVPKQPDRERSMPYRTARVIAEKGVPVYRRPPKTNAEAEQYTVRQLKRGYFFTIDKWTNLYDRELYRGRDYWFVPRKGTTTVRAPDFEGIEIGADTAVPFVWVTDPTAKLCPQPAPDACEPVERYTRLPYAGKRTARGRWYKTGDGRWISALHVARVSRTKRPADVGAKERWIHVALRNQFAALYEGDTMTFATLISSGDKEHPTPKGTFRVQSKHLTATMDDENNLASPYFIQDVPWTIFFKGSYALHGAFWHNSFGLKRSHGCVNLSPADALRFFSFAAPELPAPLHAVYVRPSNPTTVIHISD